MDVFIHYGMAAGIKPYVMPGSTVRSLGPERIGVSIGSGIGGLPMIESTCDDFRRQVVCARCRRSSFPVRSST
jgi:3-oxoacyl-[acyl-carrier-protein] synthase II